jgi:hypothetical protein
MILLVFVELVLFLLLTGSGEAEEPKFEEWQVDVAGNYKWRCTADRKTCEAWTALSMRLHEMDCYQRMKEAIRAMDGFVQGKTGWKVYQDPGDGNIVKWIPHIKEKDQWNQVMRDCVKETP